MQIPFAAPAVASKFASGPSPESSGGTRTNVASSSMTARFVVDQRLLHLSVIADNRNDMRLYGSGPRAISTARSIVNASL